MQRYILFLVSCITVIAASAQIEVGIRDNRYVYGQYMFNGHYTLKLEESIHAEKIGFQTLRGYLGYEGTVSKFSYGGNLFYGAAYNGSYYNCGMMLYGRYQFLKRLIGDVKVNPYYDSGLDYKTCFAVGAGVAITKAIDVMIAYTTIPEYRMSEHRIQGGFDFHVGALQVAPRLSISVDGADKAKTLRSLMSFSYKF